MRAKMTIDTERCKGCGLCVSVCPVKIMKIDRSITNKKGYHATSNIAIEKCIACGSCAITCPEAAITLEKD
ncbi:ferredoxin family protein [Oscillibacter sp. GMB15532]|uniref:4Fe-4S dicluster domain-containing protein n=1 Tax=Oscillibacter sp. GMB15532 TaxID=3230022 RepID=UPI0034DE1011